MTEIERLKKELEIIAETHSKVRSIPKELQNSLYLQFKDTDIVTLLIDRYEYNFDIEIDIMALTGKTIDYSSELKLTEDERKEITLLVSQSNFTYDPELLKFVDINALKVYHAQTKKEHIEFTDLPQLLILFKR